MQSRTEPQCRCSAWSPQEASASVSDSCCEMSCQHRGKSRSAAERALCNMSGHTWKRVHECVYSTCLCPNECVNVQWGFSRKPISSPHTHTHTHTHTHAFSHDSPLIPLGDSFLIKSSAASESQFKHVECIYPFMMAEISLIKNVSTWFDIVIYVCTERGCCEDNYRLFKATCPHTWWH